ncbi:MAG: Bax inhibitor-1/YccA family protein [Candidatus Omnitrophica bacterium]|nr:Bax inhibitor-1/YccA family protein [Candidatus Omnitrophota bacterium]
MRSGNPALNVSAFTKVEKLANAASMTINGTVNKTFLLLFITVFSASWVWENPVNFLPFLLPSAIAGMIIAFVTIFKKEWAPATSWIYALIEGLVLGAISAIMEKSYPGIVIQAVALTFGTLFCMLIAYKSKLIKVTENFRLGIVAATGAIALIYIVNIVMGFFGSRIPFIHESGPIGIGFSLFVVAIAAFNLVLDFDFIEKGAEYRAPKYMEWYGAFALMVTLIWLYIEILRLLSKTRRR